MTVYLVGAGPGDPGLLTVRGRDVLEAAEVVIYDRLSVSLLLDLAPADAERISVGKTPGQPGITQDQINELLIEHGHAGREVVRLKGGDPFVFARGGEEAAALIAAGVDFEVVPGISSAIAAPAYAGIPVTMRHSSTSLHVITGHEDPSKGTEVEWEAVARLGGTIVILMGVRRIATIAERLMAGGLPADTPAAAVRWGTRPQQHTVRTTLGEIGQAELESPSVIVVGRVAGLDLAWYERRPLFGKTVVVTRTRSQASVLSSSLAEHGALPVEVPVIQIVDPDDGAAALRSAAAAVELGAYDWVIFTSANAVPRFFDEVGDARALAGTLVAAIGQGTADELARFGIKADLLPAEYVAESLLDAMPNPAGGRVLLPRAAVARDTLPDGLRAAGWQVDVVDAYKTVPADVSDRQRNLIAEADIVTFTASSTVHNFVESVGLDHVPPVVACIGPITAETARSYGMTVDIEAAPHTIEGLVAAIVDHA